MLPVGLNICSIANIFFLVSVTPQPNTQTHKTTVVTRMAIFAKSRIRLFFWFLMIDIFRTNGSLGMWLAKSLFGSSIFFTPFEPKSGETGFYLYLFEQIWSQYRPCTQKIRADLEKKIFYTISLKNRVVTNGHQPTNQLNNWIHSPS